MPEETNTETTTEKPASALDDFRARENSFKTGNTKPAEAKKPEAKKEATPEKEASKKEDKKPEGDPEKEPESNDPTEKRLKDKDRYITKLIEERKALEAKLAKRDKLINRFSDAVEVDEEGEPKDWNFEKVKKETKKENDDPKPEEPTEEDDWKTALKKEREVLKWELRQEEKKRRAEEEQKQKLKEQQDEMKTSNEVFQEAVDENIEMTVTLYPDFNDPDSELRKEAEKHFAANPKLRYRPDANFICASHAASVLGIKPAYSSGEAEPEPEKPKKETKPAKPTLLDLGRQSGKTDINPARARLDSFLQRENSFRRR